MNVSLYKCHENFLLQGLEIEVHRKLYPKDENASVSMKHSIVSVALNLL